MFSENQIKTVCFQILEMKPADDKDLIKKQFRKLVKKWHPDKVHNIKLKEIAELKFKTIKHAYDILTKDIEPDYNILQLYLNLEENISQDVKQNINDIFESGINVDDVIEKVHEIFNKLKMKMINNYWNCYKSESQLFIQNIMSKIISYKNKYDIKWSLHKDLNNCYNQFITNLKSNLYKQFNNLLSEIQNECNNLFNFNLDKLKKLEKDYLNKEIFFNLVILISIITFSISGTIIFNLPVGIALGSFVGIIVARIVIRIILVQRYKLFNLHLRKSGFFDNNIFKNIVIDNKLSTLETGGIGAFIAAGLGFLFGGPPGAVLGGAIGGGLGALFGEKLETTKKKIVEQLDPFLTKLLTDLKSDLDKNLEFEFNNLWFHVRDEIRILYKKYQNIYKNSEKIVAKQIRYRYHKTQPEKNQKRSFKEWCVYIIENYF